MPSHIMVVDQDVAIRRLVQFLLQNEGFTVTAPEDGDAARALLAEQPADALILDLVTPEVGLALGRELRADRRWDRVPVLGLTGRDQTVDKYEAYKAGFDGCLTKPFDPLELVFSLRALLRLARQGDVSGSPTMGPEGFRLTPTKFTVTTARGEVSLTRLETALLAFLMRHPGEVFAADELAETVLQEARSHARTVDAVHAHVRNLRAKVEVDPKQPEWIRTMGRRGYFFAG